MTRSSGRGILCLVLSSSIFSGGVGLAFWSAAVKTWFDFALDMLRKRHGKRRGLSTWVESEPKSKRASFRFICFYCVFEGGAGGFVRFRANVCPVSTPTNLLDLLRCQQHAHTLIYTQKLSKATHSSGSTKDRDCRSGPTSGSAGRSGCEPVPHHLLNAGSHTSARYPVDHRTRWRLLVLSLSSSPIRVSPNCTLNRH